MLARLNLGQMNVGDTVRVVGLDKADRAYREKLLAFGLTPGTLIDIVRVAPLGDPLEIRVRGFALSLRRGEAAAVAVERLEPSARPAS